MGRPLAPSEAAAALRRGVQIEQFISLAGGKVRYLTTSRAGGEFALTEHHVYDDGADDFADVGEFRPVDEDDDVGEGRTVAVFATPEEAVHAAQGCGGSPDRWVNQAMAADDYLAAKRT